MTVSYIEKNNQVCPLPVSPSIVFMLQCVSCNYSSIISNYHFMNVSHYVIHFHIFFTFFPLQTTALVK